MVNSKVPAKLNKRRLRAQKFSEALRKYQYRWCLSTGQLALLIDKPKRTVENWLNGINGANLYSMRRICVLLNIDFEALTSGNAALDLFYDRHIIGLDAVQERFMSVGFSDPMSCFYYLTVTGSLVFNELRHAGVACRMVIGEDFSTRIDLTSDRFSGKHLLITVWSGKGIGYILCDTPMAIVIEWTRISKISVKSLVQFLTELYKKSNLLYDKSSTARNPSTVSH
jgi:hypothetical protein